ncbi:TolC family protein [Sphingomonas sp.]|uniref:TolC family protein n=1 Tax=Sphingomonas sp. TaxID=28214 RepID=UPI00289F2DBF|nr:TolC family protein [Sphingomonas sp.]
MAEFRRSIRYASVLLAITSAGSAGAQERSSGLAAAYRAALQRDPDWLGASADADASAENEDQAKALFRPKVGIMATGGYGGATADVTLPPPVQDIDRVRLSGATLAGVAIAQQPIVNGQARAQARQLRAGAKAGAAQRDAARLQLALRVADAYFAVLGARQELMSYQAQEATARREQRAAQARFDAGRARITDVREAQARGDGAKAQSIAAQARLETSVARYGELTGLDGDTVVSLRPDLAPRLPVGSIRDWQARAEAASPVVIARRHAADAATFRIDEFGWRSRVTVDAVGAAGTLRAPGQDGVAALNGVTGYTVALRLQMPLYTGGGLESQRRQAMLQARAAREQVDAARRDVRLNVQQAWTGQASSVAAIAALNTAVVSARLRERAALTGRDVGIRTQSDVLMAQAATIETERQLNDAQRDYERSRLALLASANQLDEKALQMIDLDFAPDQPIGDD